MSTFEPYTQPNQQPHFPVQEHPSQPQPVTPTQSHFEPTPQLPPSPQPPKSNLSTQVLIMLLLAVVCGFIGFYVGYFVAPKSTVQPNPTPSTFGTITNPTATNQLLTGQPTTKPATTPVIDITPTTTKQWGPESLWSNVPGKSTNYLKQNVTYTLPTRWQKLECGGEIVTFNPIGGTDTCETEGDAFAIILSANSPYLYQSLERQTSIKILEKRNITVGVWPAIEYQVDIIEGPYMGSGYFETVIFRNEDEYIYVTLNEPSQRAVYDTFIDNLQIK